MIPNLSLISAVGFAVKGNNELTDSVVFAGEIQKNIERIKTHRQVIRFMNKRIHEGKELLNFLTEYLSYLNSEYQKKSDPLIFDQIQYFSEMLCKVRNLKII